MDRLPPPKPFSAFERMIAWRYLRARRKESFISVIAGFSFLGIMLGVATLIIVMAVMNGFRTELLNKILGVNGHAIVQGIGNDISEFDALVDKIKTVQGVTQAVPLIEGQVMATTSQAATGALVRGMREADLLQLPSVADTIRAGTLEDFDTAIGVAIGSRLANKLGIVVGENITLITPRGVETPFGVAPKISTFPVSAIFQIGMSEYDSIFVFMPLALAQEFFNVENAVTAIEVMVDDPDRVGDYRTALLNVASGPVRLRTWQETNQSFFNALQVERNVMFLILTMIVLVAALNIISGLIMLVKDKGRDIAVLRSMGATRGAVMRIFFIAGAAIGFLGTFAGLALGLVVCLNVESIRQFLSWLTNTELFSPELYFLSQLPAELDVREVVTVVIMALVLSFIATLYPSWRAARVDPVEALRYE